MLCSQRTRLAQTKKMKYHFVKKCDENRDFKTFFAIVHARARRLSFLRQRKIFFVVLFPSMKNVSHWSDAMTYQRWNDGV